MGDGALDVVLRHALVKIDGGGETCHEGIGRLGEAAGREAGDSGAGQVGPRLAEALGYAKEEIIGRPFLEFFSLADRKRVWESVFGERSDCEARAMLPSRATAQK